MKIRDIRAMGAGTAAMAMVGLRAFAGVLGAGVITGCSGSNNPGGVTCGEGTVLEGNECVADDGSGGGGSDPGTTAGGGGAGSGGNTTTGGGTTSGGSGGNTSTGGSGGAGSGGSGGCVEGECVAPAAATFQTEPGYFDVVLDTERHQVFLSYGGSGNVHVIDLASGSDKVVTTGWKAEYMHFDPVQDQVAISLPSGMHSAYWWDEDQEGYVAAIDATTLADPTPIWIPLDPWQIVSDGTGYVYAAGASGQWTSAISVNLETGWSQLSGGIIRNGTNIQLHPDKNRVYGADNGLSPSDIERWDLEAGTVAYSYDSPYHGDYPMCGDLRIHPSGNTIYTRCGHIFLATNVVGTDMTWVADMGLSWKDLTFHPSGSAAYVITDNAPQIHEYDPATLAPVGTHPLAAPADRILAGPSYLVVISDILGGNPKTQIEVIPYADL